MKKGINQDAFHHLKNSWNPAFIGIAHMYIPIRHTGPIKKLKSLLGNQLKNNLKTRVTANIVANRTSIGPMIIM